jgi:hypothetical protein
LPDLTPPQVSSKGVPEARFPTFPVTSRCQPTFSPGASRISTPGFPCGTTRSTIPEISRHLLLASKVWTRMPKTPPQISSKGVPEARSPTFSVTSRCQPTFRSRDLPDQHSQVPLRYYQKHSPRDFPLPPAGNQSLDTGVPYARPNPTPGIQ